jgi:hypothetical protein
LRPMPLFFQAFSFGFDMLWASMRASADIPLQRTPFLPI